jgi:integration host factor subunit beta
MTKKDIVRTIAEQIDLPQLRTKELVQRTFDALIDALVREGRIELRNFGVFQIRRRDARVGRNPRTGERVVVMAKSVVTFKPGKEMEARVRELDSGFSGTTPVVDDDSIYDDMDGASENDESGDNE